MIDETRPTPSPRILRQLGADPTKPLGDRVRDIAGRMQRHSSSPSDQHTAIIAGHLGSLLRKFEEIDAAPSEPEHADYKRLVATQEAGTVLVDILYDIRRNARFSVGGDSPTDPEFELGNYAHERFRSVAEEIDAAAEEGFPQMWEVVRTCVGDIEAKLVEQADTLSSRLGGGNFGPV